MNAFLACFLLLAKRAPATSPNFRVEANRLTNEIISTFFDARAKTWKPTVASADAVGTQGYTFWPSVMAWQAVIDAARVDPKDWKPRVATYYDCLEPYFDHAKHAYCAWKYFPGNTDHFYDDNAWAVIACMDAFDVTREVRYRQRAVDILDGFLRGGWDGTGQPGGMKWGTANFPDRNDRNACSTSGCALAALLVAKVHDPVANRTWAKQMLDWVHERLSAPNGLIDDGLKSPTYARSNTIWTYNTGVAIRAAVEYYEQTKDKSYLDWAVRMGNAAIDRSQSPLYDGAVKDAAKRCWYDSTFFVAYLVDGLRALSRATVDEKYVAEARRNAVYCYRYLRDSDGLYWRNMRLWTIDADRTREFHKLMGQESPPLSPDASERSNEPSALKLPVGSRPMVKTLLGNAGAAQIFWLLAR